MYQYQYITDTIAAIATPAGQGGIGIVRISGSQALAMADVIVRLKNNQKPSQQKAFTVHYGWVIDGEATIDEVLCTLMRAPKSYTAEDVIEISTHGGFVIARAVLDLVLSKGARLAEPGEFTKRAFLNGRIDLTQAEAVLDAINAKTEQFARVTQHQLKGELSTELESIRQELMSVYITIEALINFPEDDIDAQGRAQLHSRIEAQHAHVSKLLSSAHNGRILKEGIRVVLCGKPNVGKSSLLNVLLKQERAIVTNIAGTTRDVLEESAQIKGVPLQLVDTAGILEPRDLIEEEAIKRSHLFIDQADLILCVLDSSQSLEESDFILMDKIKNRNVLFLLNKSDLPQVIDHKALFGDKIVKVSALKRESIDVLEEAILKCVWQGNVSQRLISPGLNLETNGIVVSNLRHIQALKNAQGNLEESLKLLKESASWEFISQGIKDAINQLDHITGRNIDEDLLNRIFSEFCIGK